MKAALVLACDDNFIAYASVVARRVAELSEERFPVIIVSDGVTDENKKLARTFCPHASIVEASHLFVGRPFAAHHLSRAAFLRLFLDEILPDLDRAVYLDCDMSPLVDLSPLLAMSPSAAPVMATYDLIQLQDDRIYSRLPLDRRAGYFNSGLTVLDLRAAREERIFEDAIRFALENPEKCHLVDQDALNVVLQGRWQVLDWRWNVANLETRRLPPPYFVRHHAGAFKPWTPDKRYIERSIVDRWKADLAESPWPKKFSESTETAPRLSGRKRLKRWVKAKLGIRSDAQDKWVQDYLSIVAAALPHIDAAGKAGELGRAISLAPRTAKPTEGWTEAT